MRQFISLTILIVTYSIGSGQICSGPLNISIDGSDSGNALSVSYIHSNVYCAKTATGAIELNPEGGTPGYSYKWSTGESSSALYNLNPGMYQVTVTDAVDCTKVIAIDIGTLNPDSYNLYLAKEKGCSKCSLKDSSSTFMYLGVDYTVEITDIYDLRDIGEIEACIDIVDEHMIFNDRPLLRRSWSFTATDNKASLKLFFSEEELMDLLERAGYSEIGQALPSKLSIRKFDGGAQRPDNYETVNTQSNVHLKKYHEQEEVWYVEVPNILFEEGKFTSLYLEIAPANGIISSTEDIIELDTELEFYVFSNPVEDIVRIGIDDPTHLGSGELIVYNKIGQELKREEFFKEDLNGHAINVFDYPSGLYLIVIRYKDREFTQTLKFIKV